MSSKKVLGRGLGAFFPDIDENNDKDSAGSEKTADPKIADPKKRVNVVLELPVEHIRANPDQPRKEFDPERLDELADSVKKHGLIQPVTVRYLGEKRFELISGERRLRAARQAGLKKLPAYVREVEDEEILSLALVENIQREDLNPLEVAVGYQRLMDEAGKTQAEVAEKVGKNRSTVANMLRLLSLPPYVQAALRDREISMGHARALINIEDDSDKRQIFKKIIEKGYSVRQTEKAVRALAGKKTSPGKSSGQPANNGNNAFLNDISSRLRSTLSTKVNIKSKKKGGEIRIEYYSNEELERLLELFESIS
jgi:ParB family chromosome partitioning protein